MAIFVVLHGIYTAISVTGDVVEFTGGISDLYYLQLTNQVAVFHLAVV